MSSASRFPLLLAAGLLVLVASVLFLVFSPGKESDPPPEVPLSSSIPVTPPRPPVTDHPSMAMVSDLLSPEVDAERDLEILEILLNDFARALGENPVGENDEIIAALQGMNAKGLRFFPAQHRALSPEGKLLDRWGTPWFFHALSGRSMDIISAGPDGEFGTGDDLRGEKTR